MTHAMLSRSADTYQPALSNRGQAVKWLMDRMNGDVSVAELAVQVRQGFPGLLSTDSEALRFVKEVSGYVS